MSYPPQSYWRGLPAQADVPGRAAPGDEFAPGASEAPDEISRRALLKLVGGSLSLAGLTACRRPVEKIVPFVQPPEQLLPGVPLHYATTMPFGAAAYGLVVESHQGRPTKIEGNELHPASGGASSVWMQASILGLYDPDRSAKVRGPSDPEKKRPTPTTWAEAESAWKALAETFAGNGGQGLAVLTESFASPTLERLATLFRSRYPQALWAVYEPLGDGNVRLGLEQAAGGSWRPLHRFDRARVILCLDADPLMTDLESVRHGRGFADGRRVSGASGEMNRLYVVESAMSVTGANADHRLRLRSSRIAAFVDRLATELANQGLALDGAAGGNTAADVNAGWVHAVAGDLIAHRGRGLVLAGEGQPPEVHAAVHAVNAALGNVGSTVTLTAVDTSGASDVASLQGLVQAMAGGNISTLVMLGGNPVYDAPADLEFASALSKVAQAFHLSLHEDETSKVCAWHLPRSHYLESWADARSADGTLSVVQPLIAPLFDGRSSIELLALIAGAEPLTGHDLVRETWQPTLGGEEFERRWAQVLHDGLLQHEERNEAAGTPDTTAVLAALRRAAAGTPAGFELVFRASPAVHDGRFANNAWLQELPDPITKITWDNAALVSPATAAALGVSEGGLLRIRHAGRELELPSWIVPGQADDSVVLPLGYGRRAAGRIGDGVGFDAYPLRITDGMSFSTANVQVERVAGSYELAETQHHGEMDELGEQEQAKRIPLIVRETNLTEHHEHPQWVDERAPEHPPLLSLWKEPPYTDEQQWGMTIDLNACTGCNACVVACQSENNIPVVGKDQVRRGREMHWIRVDRYFKGEPSDAGAVFQPVPCMHCENAPCEQVCPVAATVHDNQGLNTMVYNRCIGTRYCSNNCPYKVRRFNHFNFTKDTPEILQLAANPDVTVRSRGVMEKCTYCVQRINEGRLAAKLEGRPLKDGDVRTACEQACPAGAISFGNTRDDSSRVSRLKADPRNYVLLAELNNRPRTSYLGKLRNPNPELEAS